MYQCSYCTAAFSVLPAKGGCPQCGGPNPKQLKPEVVQVVKKEYVYVPTREYYTPPFHSHPVAYARSAYFGRFGYRLGVVGFVLATAFVVWQVYGAFFTKGNPVANVGPNIPTPQPTKAFVEPTQPFGNIAFLSAQASEDLRLEENVINVAVLGDGYGARYMADYAVVLKTESWEEVQQVFGISAFSAGGSTINIQVDSVTYTLNKHQGFLLATDPDIVYVVADNDTMWKHDFSQDVLVPIAEAQEQLKTTIPANPNLSLTLR